MKRYLFGTLVVVFGLLGLAIFGQFVIKGFDFNSIFAAPNILWETGLESGDISDFRSQSSSAPWTSGPGSSSYSVTTERAHSGRYSLKQTFDTRNGVAGSRWPVRKADGNGLPDEAYYGVWFYLPQNFTDSWWNFMQWKRAYDFGNGKRSSDPVASINFENRSDGKLYFYLSYKVDGSGDYLPNGLRKQAESKIAIPTGQWVHLECYYRWSIKRDGDIVCWQNGQQIFSYNDVITEFDYPYDSDIEERQYAVNSYGQSIVPSPYTLYLDDFTVSKDRVGPNGTGGGPSTPQPTASTPRPTTSPTSTPAPNTGSFFEAEDGVISQPFRVQNGSVFQDSDTDNISGGSALYTYNVSRSGDYSVRVRVNAPDGGSNSFFVDFDSEPTNPDDVWDIDTTNGFQDRYISRRGNGTPDNNEENPRVFHLSRGNHTLIIRGREANTRIDNLTLVNAGSTPAPTPTPTNTPKPSATPTPTPTAQPVGLVFEAESGDLTLPFRRQNDYVYQADYTDENNGGEANYTVNIPESGEYVIKALVDADNTGSNSFFINFDGQPVSPDMIWDVEPTSGYDERYVSWRGSGTFDDNEFEPKVFNLSRGNHRLVIRGREGYTYLDRLSIEKYDSSVPGGGPSPDADREPPSVIITSPRSDEEISGNYDVVANVSDNEGIAKVEFYVDGTLAETEYRAPYVFRMDTTDYDDGFHSLSVTAYDNASNQASQFLVFSIDNNDTDRPTTPGNLQANASGNAISLSWNASSDSNGIAGYYVVRNGQTISTTTNTNYSDSSAQCGVEYAYKIYAVDRNGNFSRASNTASATRSCQADTQAPSTPQNVELSVVGTDQIVVTWGRSNDNVGVVGYQVFRNGNRIATVSGRSFGDAIVDSGKTYSYRIRAVDGAGNVSGFSEEVSLSIPSFDLRREGVLFGIITDGATGEPIRDARVYISENRRSRWSGFTAYGRTDENGYYAFGLPEGRYYMVVSADGYDRVFEEVSIDQGEVIRLDIGTQENERY